MVLGTAIGLAGLSPYRKIIQNSCFLFNKRMRLTVGARLRVAALALTLGGTLDKHMFSQRCKAGALRTLLLAWAAAALLPSAALAQTSADGAVRRFRQCVSTAASQLGQGASSHEALIESCDSSWQEWLTSCASERSMKTPGYADVRCDEEGRRIIDSATLQPRPASQPEPQQTPPAQQLSANAFSDYQKGLPLPGLPNLDRPVYLERLRLACRRPGTFALNNVEIMLKTGQCTASNDRIRVSVVPPRGIQEYYAAYMQRVVFVVWRSPRVSDASVNSGWVYVDSLTN